MIKPLVIFLLLSSMWASTDESTCDVSVSSPGKQYTYIPQSSTVYINCTGESSQSPVWSVRLTETAENQHQFGSRSTELLNNRGFYEFNLTSDGPNQTVVQLLANSTTYESNRTLVKCTDVASLENPTLFETTLVIYEPSPISFTLRDLGVRSINVSWSPLSSLDVNHSQTYYFLTVKSHNTFNESFQLNQPYYNFIAPEDAPPCDVYKFSVTATYVGATYTGAGCSTPGSKSTMLQSLPDILSLESSLEYVLMKTSSKIVLVISFEPSNYCEQYPVPDYKLEIKGPSSDVQNQSVLPRMENTIHNLTENTIYSFRVLVSNSVGVVSTNIRQIFTTDVQNVTATLIESMNALVVQCEFITGSNAKGCVVVLVSDFGNSTHVLDRIDPCVLEFFNTTDPFIESSCKVSLFAFDIESDGSIGTLAVPGVIMTRNESVTASCPITTTTNTRDLSSVRIIAIGCGVAIATIVLIVLAIIIFCICCKLIKRSKKPLTSVQPSNNIYLDEPDTIISESGHCTNERLESEAAEILYDQPVKALGRCSGDGAEYDKTKHIKNLEDAIDERDMNTYAELAEEDHHYHTLEPQRLPQGIKVDAVALPPPYRPPSTFPQPAYQEIGSLQVAKYDQERECTRGEIVDIQLLNQSSTHGHLSQPHPPPPPPPGGIQLISETLL